MELMTPASDGNGKQVTGIQEFGYCNRGGRKNDERNQQTAHQPERDHTGISVDPFGAISHWSSRLFSGRTVVPVIITTGPAILFPLYFAIEMTISENSRASSG